MTQGIRSKVGAQEGAKEKGSPTQLSYPARSLTAKLKLSEIQVVSCLGCMRQVRSGKRDRKKPPKRSSLTHLQAFPMTGWNTADTHSLSPSGPTT